MADGVAAGPAQMDGPPTRTDWAFQVLRSEILIGELEPGQRLKINELVERYDALSPTPVREALARLAELGLVQLTPRRGVRVTPRSDDELRDLQDTRVVLEERAARLTVSNASEEWIDELDSAFAALEDKSMTFAQASFPLSASDLAGWEQLHRRFHMVLIGRAGSQWLLRLIDILFENSMRYRFAELRSDAAAFDRSLGSHRRLRDLAVASDADGLVAELVAHAQLALGSD